jgi:MinD-like ATPase involved in chromosome partitioning or flagellar assembly
MPKVISIHSYRGGTGKSNVTANLAATLTRQGHRVGVIDTDLPSPGIHNILGLDAEQTQGTLNQFLWEEAAIEDVAHDISDRLGADHSGALFLVPSSVKPDDIARILKDGYDVRLLNDGFRRLVKSLRLDYLFIDTHPGLSKETFLSIAISHVLLLILRPDKQDYQGTAVTIDIARQLRVKAMKLIINKAYRQLDPHTLKHRVEDTYDVPVAGVFPLSEDVVKLASEGIFCVQFPEHPISQEFYSIADQLAMA